MQFHMHFALVLGWTADCAAVSKLPLGSSLRTAGRRRERRAERDEACLGARFAQNIEPKRSRCIWAASQL